jgi:hypothetical protein
MNKTFLLQLPPSVRFVLMALGRYANDQDICWPGIARLSKMTGFCEKTVVRAIRVLSRLEIIDVRKNPKGINHIYTLYVTGDIKAWDEYLKSKEHVLKEINRDNQSTSITPKSIYKYSINNKSEEEENEEVLVAGDKSPAFTPTNKSKDILGGDILDIPPGKRKAMLQIIWEETIPKYFKGLKVVSKPDDKWAIDKIYNDYEEKLPIYEFIEYIIINWSIFARTAKKDHPDSHSKAFPTTPDLSYILYYMELAVLMFWDSREKA